MMWYDHMHPATLPMIRLDAAEAAPAKGGLRHGKTLGTQQAGWAPPRTSHPACFVRFSLTDKPGLSVLASPFASASPHGGNITPYVSFRRYYKNTLHPPRRSSSLTTPPFIARMVSL